jgi:hypothetical protein
METCNVIDGGTEVCLEVNAEKTKYMLLSLHQNAGQNYEMKMPFEIVGQFKYLGRTVTNQHFILEEIKWGLNSGNACYHSAPHLLFSRLLSKKVKIVHIKL